MVSSHVSLSDSASAVLNELFYILESEADSTEWSDNYFVILTIMSVMNCHSGEKKKVRLEKNSEFWPQVNSFSNKSSGFKNKFCCLNINSEILNYFESLSL